MTQVKKKHRMYHRHRCVAWATLDTVLEEEGVAIVEVKPLMATPDTPESCCTHAVAPESNVVDGHEPAVSAAATGVYRPVGTRMGLATPTSMLLLILFSSP
jgi:hypothetical protein